MWYLSDYKQNFLILFAFVVLCIKENKILRYVRRKLVKKSPVGTR
jgi:hypothetical protein